MIHFLNSLILPALIAVSLPFIIQLLNRNKNVKIKFSAVRFLKMLENNTVRQLKLYQILLLIVRALIILFIVLAFARPTLTTANGSSSGTPSTAVILLDDSYSMDSYASSQTYMDRANALLPKILSAYTSTDKVYILKMVSPEPIKISAQDLDHAPRFKSTYGVVKANSALAVSDSLMERFANISNDLFIISDFRFKTGNGISSYKNLQKANRYLINLSQSSQLLDLSIDSVAVLNQIFEQGRPLNFTVFISNHSEQKPSETAVNVFIGEQRAGTQSVSVPAGKQVRVPLTFTPQQNGFVNIRFQIKEDDLSANNKYFYTLNIPKKISLLFIHPKGNEALSSALAVLNKNSLFNITGADISSAPSYNFSAYQLIVMRGDAPSAMLARKLNNYTSNGGHVLLMPQAGQSVQKFQNVFRALKLPVKVRSKVEFSGNDYATINMSDAPSFWGAVFLDRNKFNEPPVFYSYFKLNAVSDVLLRLSNRSGVFVREKNYFILTTALSKQTTDITENALFLPLLYRFFYIASLGRTQKTSQLKIYDRLHFVPVGFSAGETYQMLTPQKRHISLVPRPVKSRIEFDAGVANQPGFYFLMHNDTILQSLAVNVSNKEFMPPYVNKDQIGQMLSGPATIKSTILQAHAGREVWLYLVLLVLLLLALEMFLIKKIEGSPF